MVFELAICNRGKLLEELYGAGEEVREEDSCWWWWVREGSEWCSIIKDGQSGAGAY